MNATDTELLTYGTVELAAFRADMRRRRRGVSTGDVATRKGVLQALRNSEARRNAAGLTPAQAERACVLAAKAERKAVHP